MRKILLTIILFFIFTADSYSQCSMLSAIMESEQAYDSAKSLNNGTNIPPEQPNKIHIPEPLSDLYMHIKSYKIL